MFVDTSAVYALIDGDDDNHAGAAAYLRELAEGDGRVAILHADGNFEVLARHTEVVIHRPD